MNEQSKLFEIDQHVDSAIRLARLPTNTTTRNHPVHRWFNFIAGFSPELVSACIELETSNSSKPTLLDPFSGCGTAPLQARIEGGHSIGYEPHPFFALISEAKSNSHLYRDDFLKVRQTIERGLRKRANVENALSHSASIFLLKMFDADDLASLCAARQELETEGLERHPLAFVMLSRILDHSCFAATDGIYKAPTSKKSSISPLPAFEKVYALMRADREHASKSEGSSLVIEKSAEDMSDIEDNTVDLVVTSPPYLNNFDFAEMTRMYLYFWRMADCWGEITEKVRSRLVVNTTTALKGHKDKQVQYRGTLSDCVLREADEVVQQLSDMRSQKAGKKEYDFLVYPYLKQMQSVLSEMRRCLRPGAPMHMMVSDAALYGVHVPSPQWLRVMMKEMGFNSVSCEMVRPRGHRWVLDKREGSKKGLGEYYLFGRA